MSVDIHFYVFVFVQPAMQPSEPTSLCLDQSVAKSITAGHDVIGICFDELRVIMFYFHPQIKDVCLSI